MAITLMTAADFGDKQGVSNQSNSTIWRRSWYCSVCTWGARGNAKNILKKFCPKNEVGATSILLYIRYI
jgi:hypothetical protein